MMVRIVVQSAASLAETIADENGAVVIDADVSEPVGVRPNIKLFKTLDRRRFTTADGPQREWTL
ncbi:MAG TPA: hypothetical protein VGO73_04690 [Pyrinomonadaceae bacterium]|jgi:hypothetical protein|nr:hypothetical protein [Pyrinomonadaceae bacterium]